MSVSALFVGILSFNVHSPASYCEKYYQLCNGKQTQSSAVYDAFSKISCIQLRKKFYEKCGVRRAVSIATDLLKRFITTLKSSADKNIMAKNIIAETKLPSREPLKNI